MEEKLNKDNYKYRIIKNGHGIYYVQYRSNKWYWPFWKFLEKPSNRTEGRISFYNYSQSTYRPKYVSDFCAKQALEKHKLEMKQVRENKRKDKIKFEVIYDETKCI